MEAEIITIGDELLLGLTVDTNSAWLGRVLSRLGVTVKYRVTVGDDPELIESTLRTALSRVDLVICAGGLGPTPDDVTKRAVAKLFKSKLVLDDGVLKAVEAHFEARGMSMPAISAQQALIPRGAAVLKNPIGTAPGLLFSKEEKLLFVLPGVPGELKAMFQARVLPMLEEKGGERGWHYRVIRTTGVSESEIAQKLSSLLKGVRKAKLASIPTHTGVDLKLTVRARYEGLAQKELKTLEDEICSALGEVVYGRDGETLEQVVGYLLTMKKLTVSVAESCTGGLVTDRLTDVPGSSNYLQGGIVSYSNELKAKALKVSKSTLKKYGAVSSQAAVEMAEGVKKSYGTNIGLSTTGIAGPTGGSKDKPVGLVYVGLSTKASSKCEEHRFSGERRQIKESSAQAALDMLRRYLLRA